MDFYIDFEHIDWFINVGDMNGLYIDSVTKSFGIRQVLTDVYLSSNKGEIVGLLGRNGAGKSTLLKIIFGSMPADFKFVRIADKRINGLYDNRNQINYLPQHSFLPNHLKISQIIKLFCDKSSAELIATNEQIGRAHV